MVFDLLIGLQKQANAYFYAITIHGYFSAHNSFCAFLHNLHFWPCLAHFAHFELLVRQFFVHVLHFITYLHIRVFEKWDRTEIIQRKIATF